MVVEGPGFVDVMQAAVLRDAGRAGAGVELRIPLPAGQDVAVGQVDGPGCGAVGIKHFGAGNDQGAGDVAVEDALGVGDHAAGGFAGTETTGDAEPQGPGHGGDGLLGEVVGAHRDLLRGALDDRPEGLGIGATAADVEAAGQLGCDELFLAAGGVLDRQSRAGGEGLVGGAGRLEDLLGDDSPAHLEACGPVEVAHAQGFVELLLGLLQGVKPGGDQVIGLSLQEMLDGPSSLGEDLEGFARVHG